MNLKFEFKKKGFSSGIVSISVDDVGNILHLSSTNSVLEEQLKRNPNKAAFQEMVRCIVNGSICSDILQIQAKAGTIDYKVQQMA